MSRPRPDPRRRHERFLIDLPLRLWDSSHRLVDSQAVAHDVTPAGFGFETRTEAQHLGRVYFELDLPDGERVSGSARVMWSRQTDWGLWAGARVVEMSWRDKRKVLRVIHGQGYDWAGLADRTLKAAAIIACGYVLQEILDNHPAAAMAFPWVAMLACGAAVVYFNLRDSA